MRSEEIINGNKLIADWVNSQLDKDTSPRRFFTKRYDQQTPYHKDWNELMPVVKMIKLIRDSQNPCTLEMAQLIGNISLQLLSIDILKVNDAVVKFINWHNKNQPCSSTAP